MALPGALAAAAVAGLGLGVALIRNGSLAGPEPSVAAAVAPPRAPSAVMPVEVAATPLAPAAPPPTAVDRLEVLPPLPPPAPGLPRLARAPAPARQTAPAYRPQAQAPSGTPASVVTAERQAPPPRLAPEPQARDEGPCGWAETRAQRLVCEDRGLARADRRMQRAYERALRSGVPEADLAADQDDWQRIREDAARHSRDAVFSIYDQRTRELQDLADSQ